jgi:hypothetical protein
LPPGELISEKISEMGIDVAELARRMGISAETIKQLILHEIPLTPDVAETLEAVTLMPADSMMKHEVRYRKKWKYAMGHPEIPAYLGTEIINQPKPKAKKKGGDKT